MENSQTKPKKEKRKSLTKSMQRLVFGVAIIILIVASFLNGKVSDNVYSQMSDTTSEQVMTMTMIRSRMALTPRVDQSPESPS